MPDGMTSANRISLTNAVPGKASLGTAQIAATISFKDDEPETAAAVKRWDRAFAN